MTFQTPTSMASRAGLVGPSTPGMMMTQDFPVGLSPSPFPTETDREQTTNRVLDAIVSY